MIAPKSPIYKHTIEVIVLSEQQLPDEITLSAIAYAIDEGPDIGTWEVKSIDTITKRKDIKKELIAIDNDGTFFDDIFR